MGCHAMPCQWQQQPSLSGPTWTAISSRGVGWPVWCLSRRRGRWMHCRFAVADMGSGERGRPPRRRTGQHAALQCGVEPAGDAAEMLFFGVKLPRVTMTVRGLLLVVKGAGAGAVVALGTGHDTSRRRSTGGPGSLSCARDGTPLTHETRENGCGFVLLPDGVERVRCDAIWRLAPPLA